MTNIAIEHCHLVRWFTHEKWWFSIAFCRFTRPGKWPGMGWCQCQTEAKIAARWTGWVNMSGGKKSKGTCAFTQAKMWIQMDLPEKKIETVGICRNKNAASTMLPNENWDLDQFTYRFAMIYYLHVWINWLLKGRWNSFIDLGFLDGQQNLGAWDYISHASNIKKTLSVIPNLCKSFTKLTKALLKHGFPECLLFAGWECNTSTWNGGLAMRLISKVGRGDKHGDEIIGDKGMLQKEAHGSDFPKNVFLLNCQNQTISPQKSFGDIPSRKLRLRCEKATIFM